MPTGHEQLSLSAPLTHILPSSSPASVPPAILEQQTSNDMVVREGSNVTLQCKAKGYPEPYVMWRREDGTEMLIGGEYGKSRVDPGTQIHMARSQTDSTLLIRTHASAIDHLVHPSSAAVFDHIECFAAKLLFKHSFQSLSLSLSSNPLPPPPGRPQIHCWPLVVRSNRNCGHSTLPVLCYMQ